MDQTSQSEKVFQKQKYDEIIEMLLTAGYFRARINTLSEFDKVVGGLCWCITYSGEDVDVDILFQENSTIGQRIALSEAIVKALRKMHCPCPLQAHQIQGGVGHLSDFPAIHPVIVWLVKKTLQRKEEYDAQLREFSTLQFSKNYHLPWEPKDRVISSELKRLFGKNKAIRAFKRRELKDESEETRIHSCLLEFGESFAKEIAEEEKTAYNNSASVPGKTGLAESRSSRIIVNVRNDVGGSKGASNVKGSSVVISVSDAVVQDATISPTVNFPGVGKKDATGGSSGGIATGDLSGFEKKLAQAAKEAMKEERMFAEHALKEEAVLMQEMTDIRGEDGAVVSKSQVGAIVSLGSSEIGTAAQAYSESLEASRKQMEANLATGKLGQAAAFKRQRINLISQRDEIEGKCNEILVTTNAIVEKLKLVEEERDGSAEYIAQLVEQVEKLKALEAAASQQEELTILKDLVSLNESLKAQEASFKAACKAQMAEYTAKLAAVDDSETTNAEENQKLRDIEEMHAKMSAKYNRLRQLLAETNLEIASTSRQIDDVPTRTELIQYERRFVELYQQVAWKLDETKKYYSMYNTLDTTLSYLQKEVKLLNSISENFTEAMKSSAAKTEYLQQFELIVRGVEESLQRQQIVLATRESQVDQLKIAHQHAVDEQRSYFKAVKDFQEECNKNEWLTSKLEQLKQ